MRAGTLSAADVESRFREAGLRVFERGWLSSNNVLFGKRSEEPSILVDSGYWSHQEQTAALVRGALGADGRLDRVINTHLHSDHCGGNAHLQRLFDCQVDVPAGEFEKVERWSEEELTYQPTGQHCPRFTAHGRLQAGEHFDLAGRAWNIIASPGHDPESVMLHEPSLGILISADALWEDGFGVVFPELEGFGAFDDVRRTLELISQLSVEVVIPGHGRPFIDVRTALERAHAKLDRFVADPRKHALHAAKVLIKFHLLEVQGATLSELDSWLRETSYFGSVHARHFGQHSWMDWRSELLEGLRRSRAIEFDGSIVRNL
ncbi:MAG: MBL fold metallo-hydrolase [Piscinibacter sp.]